MHRLSARLDPARIARGINPERTLRERIVVFLLPILLVACPRSVTSEDAGKAPNKNAEGTLHRPTALKGPPPLSAEIQAWERRRLRQSKPSKEKREAIQQQAQERTAEAEGLLLAADREKAAGRGPSAVSLCEKALRRGAGLETIGYRPHLCLAAFWAATGQWEAVLALFKRGKREKPHWAGFGAWRLRGAEAMAQLGDRDGARQILLGLKKDPSVAAKALRALEELEAK